MTDPQLANNNNNNTNNNNNNNTNNNNNNNNNTSTNNNNDGEPKYLHKKFKKMATSEVVVPVVEITKENTPETTGSSRCPIKRRDSPVKDAKKSSKNDDPTAPHDNEITNDTARKTGHDCPFCNQSCAKPSVLEKHIRSHTNERPYPCLPCNVSFKTKSNLYKHRRSRAHALKIENGDTGKVSEDSDSASNGTTTSPPPALAPPPVQVPSSSPSASTIKTIKTGKIYKPKFQALQCVNNDIETFPPSSNSSQNNASTIVTTTNKPIVEKVQEHIDKIITDNQAIVDAVDPRLHKLIQRQQSIIDNNITPQKIIYEQPLNLSSGDESSSSLSKKRSYSERIANDNSPLLLSSSNNNNDGTSIIKDLLLKTRWTNGIEKSEDYDTGSNSKLITNSSNIFPDNNNYIGQRMNYYSKASSTSSLSSSPQSPSPSPKRDFQLDFDTVTSKKDDDFQKLSNDYYHTIQPLPSPGPLLGNTRLVDAYGPSPVKKQRLDSVPTTLRSLEELSRYPRPNSLQMFGGEVRILDNSGETKTMRIEPRQTNSPSSNDLNGINSSSNINKCATTETSSIVVRSGIHSGGTMLHKPPGTSTNSSSKTSIIIPNSSSILTPIIPNISTPNIAPSMTCYNYLESINPLTNITAYNPLTLPQSGISSILHGGKVIPYVPGMPGPHSLSGSTTGTTTTTASSISPLPSTKQNGTLSYKVIPGIPGLHILPQPLDLASPINVQTPIVPGIPGPTSSPQLQSPLDLVNSIKDGFKSPSTNGYTSPKIQQKFDDKFFRLRATSADDYSGHIMEQGKLSVIEKSKKGDNEVATNYYRLSPKFIESKRKTGQFSDGQSDSRVKTATPEFPDDKNQRTRSESVPPVIVMDIDQPDNNSKEIVSRCVSTPETKIQQIPENNNETSPKFLRPSSLPLKPGTFTAKKHHGITPTANTENLITPDTPRPFKSYRQMYFNGNSYTYLGLKCSTKVYYCTVNRPQPMYVQQQNVLSMYSNWKICTEVSQDLELSHYDSRNRPCNTTIAGKKIDDILTHSSQRPSESYQNSDTNNIDNNNINEKSRKLIIYNGCIESNEDYTYVRGRGRGKYVCRICGIRCKKPSMLNKHIRTHTDVRPYTCKHCVFSFKTKGNLTKHMKSKAHYKKCVELLINPVPTTVCDENIDKDAIAKLQLAGGINTDDTSEEDDESDNDDSDESGNEEHEAAQSLLSLSQPNTPRQPGLLPCGRPTTYPYVQTYSSTSVTTSIVSTTTTTVTTTMGTSVSSSASTTMPEVPNRYYFPSNRPAAPGEIRDSVIRSSKIDESDVEMEEIDETRGKQQQQASQPMDLTTKTIVQSPLAVRSQQLDIFTSVSEPVLMQAIANTMERLPPQGREWKPDADGHMLQAYLTERHVMDSKMKQQYRVGTSRHDGNSMMFAEKEFTGSRSNFSNSVATVTYTDPTRKQQQQQVLMEVRQKDEEVKNERKPFDLDLHGDKQGLKHEFGQERLGVDLMMKNSRVYDRQHGKIAGNQSLRATNTEFGEQFNKVDGKLVGRDGKILDYKSEQRLQPVDSFERSKILDEARIIAGDMRNSERAEIKIPIHLGNGLNHSVARKMVVASAVSGGVARSQPEFLQPSCRPALNYASENEDGKSICRVCNKEFKKLGQLKLHMQIHFFERPYKCESCSVSFRSRGHLAKHERSTAHINKVSMGTTFGTPTSSNPRPFKCTDCDVAFRIHGHLAKHLRSKMHIMKLECLCKLPFGTYAEMERSGTNMNEIDTTDCVQSLASLQIMAHRLYEQDPSNMGRWDPEMMPRQGTSGGDTSSDEGESIPHHYQQQIPPDSEAVRAYHEATTPTTAATVNTNGNEVKETDRYRQNSRADDTTSYKCQICQRILRTFSELHTHCLVEHGSGEERGPGRGPGAANYNDRDKENTQKSLCDDGYIREDQSRQKKDDL